MDCIEQSTPSLGPELWANVFAHMEDRSEDIRSWDSFGRLDEEKNQTTFHQLKLVCKRFREIFVGYSGLVQRLYLCDGFPESALPSLLTWVQHNKKSVRRFESACARPMMASVLAGLI